MKCGGIFYKIIVLVDYFCIHFINDNEKQREEKNMGGRERKKESESKRVEKYCVEEPLLKETTKLSKCIYFFISGAIFL